MHLHGFPFSPLLPYGKTFPKVAVTGCCQEHPPSVSIHREQAGANSSFATTSHSLTGNCSVFNYPRLHQVHVVHLCVCYQLCHNKWISYSGFPAADGWASVPPWLFWLWTGLFSCCLLSPTEKNNSFWSAFYGLLETGGPHYSFGQWLTRVKTNYTRLSWCWRRNEPTSLRL